MDKNLREDCSDEILSLLQRGDEFAMKEDCEAARPLLERALQLSKESGETRYLGDIYKNLGFVYWTDGDLSATKEAYLLAREYYISDGDTRGLSASCINLASTYLEIGEVDNARKYAEEAYTLSQQTGDLTFEARASFFLGNVYTDLAEYSQALAYYQKAEAVFTSGKVDIPMELAALKSNMGLLYEELGDFATALFYFNEAAQICEDKEITFELALNYNNLGAVYSKLDDHEKSLYYFKKSLDLHRRRGDRNRLPMAYINLAIELLRSGGDQDEALRYALLALEENVKMGSISSIVICCLTVAEIYWQKGEIARSWEYLHKAEEHNASLSIPRYSLRILHRKSVLMYASQFPPQEVENSFKEAEKLASSLQAKDMLKELYEDLVTFYEQESRWQAAAATYKALYHLQQELVSEKTRRASARYEVERNFAVLKKEREITDNLLRKTFPVAVLPELKSGKTMLLQDFPSASILFADVVGFTPLSAVMPPHDVVELLNYIFTEFDLILQKYGGERIRTIGDGYMAVCGAPTLVEHHQTKLVKAALAMLRVVQQPHLQEILAQYDKKLNVRIGLHCGQLLAGIVGGLEKWQYDLYGDAVNIAARMESNGEPGKIHCTDEFYRAAHSQRPLVATPRLPMHIKGKGIMQTYFIEEIVM